jgi:hypothetical protein
LLTAVRFHRKVTYLERRDGDDDHVVESCLGMVGVDIPSLAAAATASLSLLPGMDKCKGLGIFG